jgi:uncharacterized protein YcfJ
MKPLSTILSGTAIALATLAANAQVTFYEHEGFRGRALTATKPIENFERFGFNDRASSAVVAGGRWEVCSDARFGGECRVLRPGSYDSLNRMGMGNRISSVRPVHGGRPVVDAPAPLPAPTYEYRWRPEERRYEANVISARAVFGPEKQRCWVEREQVVTNRSEPNVGGAILGGIIGGVLGHQIGGGRGNDVATGLGAVGGAAIGANAGRDNAPQAISQDVKRCSSVPGSAQPAYWDVTYTYKGITHRAQYSQNPGRTVTVNGRGEPRG